MRPSRSAAVSHSAQIDLDFTTALVDGELTIFWTYTGPVSPLVMLYPASAAPNTPFAGAPFTGLEFSEDITGIDPGDYYLIRATADGVCYGSASPVHRIS